LVSKSKPSLSGSEKAPLMLRLALRLRDFLFGLGAALAARKHWSAPLI